MLTKKYNLECHILLSSHNKNSKSKTKFLGETLKGIPFEQVMLNSLCSRNRNKAGKSEATPYVHASHVHEGHTRKQFNTQRYLIREIVSGRCSNYLTKLSMMVA